jgi:hypothetical protein
MQTMTRVPDKRSLTDRRFVTAGAVHLTLTIVRFFRGHAPSGPSSYRQQADDLNDAIIRYPSTVLAPTDKS